VDRANNKIETRLEVPSMTPIEMQLLFQGFSDLQNPFTIVTSIQSVDHHEQMPVYESGVTSARTVTGSIISAGTVSRSATTADFITSTVYPWNSRMGYELELTVNTASTHSFTVIKAQVEGSGGLVDVPVARVGTSNIYRIYLGDVGENLAGTSLFIKFIDL
jgi:hypothetical protein